MKKTTLNPIILKLLFLIFLSFCGIIQSQEKEQPYELKPFDFVAKEILNNKVVMLGENGGIDHYNLFPYLTLINVIKSWNTIAKEENTHNKTLTLIMEKSSSAVKLIKHYIDHNDINPFIDKHGSIYSLEDLYLYYKLRELTKEIKENGNKLNIVGFEINERYEDEWFFKKTDEERDQFFRKDRDSLLYENINAYIRTNPNENILIHYGNAHLEEEYCQKNDPTKTDDGKGYYLAHYLRKELGYKFVTIDQSFLDEIVNFNYGDSLIYLKDKNFLIKKKDPIFLGKLPFTKLESDFIIVKHDGLVGPHFIRNVFSKNTLIRNYNKLIEFEMFSKKYNSTFSLKPSEVNNPLVSLVLESIKMVTGREFTSIKDYKSYFDSTQNDFYHDRILKEEFSNELFMCLKNNPQDRSFKYTLFCLGFSPLLLFNQNLKTTEEDWKNALPHINYFDYVGLFWVGTDSEKSKAKQFLEEATGEKFQNAANYLEWYYKNKFHYNFN